VTTRAARTQVLSCQVRFCVWLMQLERTFRIEGLAVVNAGDGRPAVAPLGFRPPAGMRLLSVSVCGGQHEGSCLADHLILA